MSEKKVLLSLDKMSCDGCVARVQKILTRAGVDSGTTVEIGSVQLVGNAAEQAEVAITALQKAGYQVQVQL